jgi:hypothetical protein
VAAARALVDERLRGLRRSVTLPLGRVRELNTRAGGYAPGSILLAERTSYVPPP